jgi:hypothetical protein
MSTGTRRIRLRDAGEQSCGVASSLAERTARGGSAGRSASTACSRHVRWFVLGAAIVLHGCIDLSWGDGCEHSIGRDCRGDCIYDEQHEDPRFCGPLGQCTDCTQQSLGPNMVALCGWAGAGSCSAMCAYGWADCDGDPANGCETDITQPAHCNDCRTACADGVGCQRASGLWYCAHSCSEPDVQAACGDAFAHVGSLCQGRWPDAASFCAYTTSQLKDPAVWCPAVGAMDLAALRATEFGTYCCGPDRALDLEMRPPACAPLCNTSADCSGASSRPVCAAADDGSQLLGYRICVPNDGQPGHGCAGGQACTGTSVCVADPQGSFCALGCRFDGRCHSDFVQGCCYGGCTMCH